MSHNNYNNSWGTNSQQYNNNGLFDQGFQSSQQPAYQPNMNESPESNSFNQHSFKYIPPQNHFIPPSHNSYPLFNTQKSSHQNRSIFPYSQNRNEYPPAQFSSPRPRFQQISGHGGNLNGLDIIPNFPPPNFSRGPAQESFHHSPNFLPPNILNTNKVFYKEEMRPSNIKEYETNHVETKELWNDCELSSKENNEEWILSWIKKVDNRINMNKNSNILNEVKISDIQKKLLKFATKVKELEVISKDLMATSEFNFQERNTQMKKSEAVKGEVEKLRKFFDEAQNLEKMKESFRKRREKRERWRRNKLKRIERKKEIKEERRDKENKINSILQQLHEEEKTKINEQKMKKEVDSILKEVRTKQEEAVKMQKLMFALSKLRETRIKKGESHGYVGSHKANVFFSKLDDEMDKLIKEQLNLYQSEEQTLKIMMEESKPCTYSIHSKKPHTPSVNLERVQAEIFKVFFGKKVSKENQTDYERSFLSAEESLEMLVNRRHDWDQFLVKEVDKNIGTAVPIGWIIPNSEPNADWRVYQV